jgi:hypothetical protein
MLILPLLMEAFPSARVIHLVRHPVDTCLRRTHMTSRPNNAVGRAVLRAAYSELGWPFERMETDDSYLRNAASWVFQVERVASFGRSELGSAQYLEVRYEDICQDPGQVLDQVAEFTGTIVPNNCRPPEIDRSRSRQWTPPDPRADEVWSICGTTASQIGYAPISIEAGLEP